MGNRALTAALRELTLELKDDCPRFHEVVLTAPDIDANVFCRDLAPAIVRAADRVTLYASSNDEALVGLEGHPRLPPRRRHGPRPGNRAGRGYGGRFRRGHEFIGHCYYGSNRTVLADLFELIHGSKPPDQRKWLHSMQFGVQTYWKFLRTTVANAAAAARER